LDGILRTEGAIRVLRVLALSPDPLTRGEIASRTALFRGGIPRILSTLENHGVVETIGQGRSRPVRLRQQHPLAQSLRGLFWEEHQTAQRAVNGLRAAIQELQPTPKAAWIEGPVARKSDTYADPVMVGILAEDTADADRWRETLRRSVTAVQRQCDIAVEIRFAWKADLLVSSGLERERLQAVMPLVGPPPLILLGLATELPEPGDAGDRPVTHEMHDRTSRLYGRVLARLIQQRPAIIEETIRYLEQRLPTMSVREARELEEWLDMLQSYAPSRLRVFLESPSERATRLRQSAPFVYVLSERERVRVRQETLRLAARESRR
jgi:hypothetical protein